MMRIRENLLRGTTPGHGLRIFSAFQIPKTLTISADPKTKNIRFQSPLHRDFSTRLLLPFSIAGAMNYSAFAPTAAGSSLTTFVGTLPPANGVGSVETRGTPTFLRPFAKLQSCCGIYLVCDQRYKLQTTRIPGLATKGQRTVCVPFATATTERSVHDFTVKDIDGNDIFLNKFKGKVLLIVNVASKCGFTTSNYTELSHLYDVYKNQGFEVLAFPCNQFGGQEPGSNPEIKRFACTKFKAEFPIFDKVDVNGPNSAPLYEFLKASAGGFLGNLIKWNFEKFLINKNGKVVERYPPTTSPFQVEKDIKKLLAE